MGRFLPVVVALVIFLLLLMLINSPVVQHKVRGITADIVGLNRVVYLYTPFSTKPVKVYSGNIRFERRQDGSISLIVNGKKVDTNLYYIIEEK